MRAMRLAAVVAGLSLFATTAPAAVITVTLTGTLSSGFDQTGMFGAANTDLTGLSFSAVSVFDTDLGQIDYLPDSTALFGGSAFGGPSPGSATLTINGASVGIDGNLLAFIHKTQAGIGTDFEDRVIVDNVATFGAVYSNLSYDVPRTFALGADYHAVCGEGDTCNGAFFFGQETDTGPYHSYYDNHGSFNIATIDVVGEGFPPPSAGDFGVPEPATWALMIAGFGLVGASLRSKRRQLA